MPKDYELRVHYYALAGVLFVLFVLLGIFDLLQGFNVLPSPKVGGFFGQPSFSGWIGITLGTLLILVGVAVLASIWHPMEAIFLVLLLFGIFTGVVIAIQLQTSGYFWLFWFLGVAALIAALGVGAIALEHHRLKHGRGY